MSSGILPWDSYSKTVPSSDLQQHAGMQVEQSPAAVSADVSTPAVNADGSHKQQAPVADTTATTITTQLPALPLPADGISGAGKKQITGCKREKKPASGSGTVAATGETELQKAPEPKPYKRLRKKYSNPEEKEKQEHIKKEKSEAKESTEQRKKYSSPEEKEKQEQIKKGKSVAVESTEQRKNYSSPEEKEKRKQEQIKKGKSVAVHSTEQRKKYSCTEEKEKQEQIKKGKSVAVESTEQRKKYSNPEEKEKHEQIKKGISVAVESTEQRKKYSNPDEREKQEQIKKGKGVAAESTEQRKLRPRRAAEDKQKNKGQNVSTSALKVAHEKAYFKNNFSLTLTKKEIEEDFLAMTGQKPPQKPTKRPKAVSKHMDELLGQGKTLYSVRRKTYSVKEETSKKGKSFKQRFDEFIKSCECDFQI